MEKLKIEKSTAKRLYPESPGWFQEVLVETFGKKTFVVDYRDIKTFEDACEALGITPESVYFENESADAIAYKKLKVVIAAINGGWTPDWDDSNQYKWWPYFKMSSGFGFSCSSYDYAFSCTAVGSRLCFETKEKCNYAANQFIELYKQFLT